MDDCYAPRTPLPLSKLHPKFFSFAARWSLLTLQPVNAILRSSGTDLEPQACCYPPSIQKRTNEFVFVGATPLTEPDRDALIAGIEDDKEIFTQLSQAMPSSQDTYKEMFYETDIDDAEILTQLSQEQHESTSHETPRTAENSPRDRGFGITYAEHS
ncbi:hypothetical protein EJ02DRAFT_421247 [Clathrospora elynae]|uniref:Uncharacterized protein n=1 Tax=Clathrospora elynae TaxID=706981 RepID=A0A6A5T2R1_9PLEO|nr:hypothetical protein EJ02DRAFT_421247 [Clathrospora elynae]